MKTDLFITQVWILFGFNNCKIASKLHLFDRYLQHGASGSVAVVMQLILARRWAELGQLLPLQLVGGEGRQQLEEGAARHSGDIQVTLHQVAHRAGLRKPGWDWKMDSDWSVIVLKLFPSCF